MKVFTIDLDKTRTLRFEHRFLREAEALALKETGQGITALLQSQAVFFAVPLLLWAGLRHEEPTLSRQKAETLMAEHAGGFEAATMTVLEAFSESGLFSKGGAEGNARRATAPQ
ncbi:MAG TPA: hypothetical protein VD902_13525 [Symbiobacteriaceae bacterium]|nr:hypothetical protein [Symbiobacteriaceae bacterium]